MSWAGGAVEKKDDECSMKCSATKTDLLEKETASETWPLELILYDMSIL